MGRSRFTQGSFWMSPASPTTWFDRFSATCYRPHAMWATSPVRVVAGTLLMLCLAGCGGDVELDVTHSDNRKRIAGTVELPNGDLAARRGSLWQGIAATIVGRVYALTGNASPVGAGIRVELVRLSREDAAANLP